MDTQTTRSTLQILDKAEYLSSSSRTQLPTVSSELTSTFSVLPGDGPKLDWDAVQGNNVELLELATREAHQAAQAYRITKVKVAEIRLRRNQIVSGLRARHRSLRKSFEGTYTEQALPLVGLDAPPARPYLAVREQCRDVVARMGDPELLETLGEPVAGQSPLDIEKLSTDMTTEVNSFEVVIGKLTEATKRRDEALVAKKETVKHLRRVYANVARVQEGYYRLAGLDELADRIRLTIPRTSRPQDPAPAPEPTSPEPTSPEPSSPEPSPA